MSSTLDFKAVTVPSILAKKGKEPISMLTAYDFPTARMLDESGVDVLLVGDSLGTVLYGEANTLSVTMDDMLRHTRAVTRGARRSLVIGDMPFMSYQASTEEAVRNAGRFLKEAGAQAVKLEGGQEAAPAIRAITRAGIPVCAHVGLTPQSINAQGGYRMHGKTSIERRILLDGALAVQEAGAFCVVLECVELTLAEEITAKLHIPTIGIGSGAGCDGQVLVTHDLAGLTSGRVPKFVRPLADLSASLRGAVSAYLHRTETEYRQARPMRDEEAPHAPSH